ncbi:MAG TPA: putative Ig domain-containing protein [Mesorhizobium sp.]|uniref:putative Ig domain-containing protein n=1 Tax=Mesorhizobium sp. TaxID=1871066 RepID=UPI002DDC909C|nr:putative Ig domain-containing protein [Mesorhizobium sp.]HEV2507903.1 putative Ig domain-containing protein [Mesorhizobium sp.]
MLIALSWAAPAWAVCGSSQSFSVASGATFVVTCGDFGFREVRPGPLATPHGLVTQNGVNNNWVNYTNNGDGALSDTFVMTQDDGTPTTFTVTVGAASSLTVTPANLPTPAVGVPYTQALSTSGGVAPYTYSLGSGTPPPGITVSPGGVISGTSTGSGPYTFTVQVTDSTPGTPLTVNKSYSVTIPGPTLVVSPASPAAGAQGVPYSQQFTTTGGTAPYAYSHESGTMPPGLSISGSGLLSGTPTTLGSFTFTIKSQDSTTISTGGVWLKLHTVTVVINAAPTIVVSPTTLPGGAAVGSAYSTTITASGGVSPYTFAVSSGSLPAGLTLSPGGTISGTPTAGGTFNFTVRATDASGAPGPFSGTQAYSLTVAAPTITLPATTLANGTLGASYSATLNPASGGTSPYNYVVTAGALPAGVTLSATGTLSGTPTVAGTFNFSVTATDNSTGTGAPYFSTPRGYALTIVNIPPVANPVSATVGYNSGANPITLNITGGTPTSVAIGTAAANGTAIASGTSITYQPNTGFRGSDSFTYTATNSAGTSAPATVTITVSNPTITVSPSGALTAQVGVAYTQTFTASGGAAPYTLAVSGLPAGLSTTGTTSSSVTVSGTPTAAGSFSLDVTGTDSSTGTGPVSISQPFTLSVSAPTLTLTPPAGTLSATYATAYSQQYTASGGTWPYTYTVSAGALPAGLSLDPISGVLSGTPTVTGLFTFSVRATDSSTGTGAPFARTQNYVMQVAAPTIVVSPSTLTNATAASSYSATFTASGGIGPYTFSTVPATLPAGLSLATDGQLTGTPTQSGNFAFTVTATDAHGQTGSRLYNLTVGLPSLTVSPPSLPDGTVASGYNQTLSASGGNSPYTFAITSGAQPTGLTLSTTGTLSGTPTAPGTFNFTVTATDATTGTAATGSTAYTVKIIDIPPVANPVSATVGYGSSANPVTLNITGGAAVSVAIATLADHGTATATGLSISYTPTPGYRGPDTFTYTATNSGGTSAPATVSITVGDPTIVVNASGPLAAQIGTAYTQTFTASGGAAPYTVAVSGLPAGLSTTGTTSNSVTVSGTPTAAGSFNLTVTATDSSSGTGPVSTSQPFTLTVGAPTLGLTPPAGTIPVPYGAAFSQQFTASGGTTPYSYTVSAGTLPTGLNLSGSGELSGTATVPGSYNVTVRATDSSTGAGAPFSTDVSYTLQVATPVVVVNPTTLANATAGSNYSDTVTATGAVAPYSFSVTAGTLPAGIVLGSTGALSGTPTAAGNFSFTITASDAHGQTGSRPYTMTVAVPSLTMLPPSVPSGTAGTAYSQTLTASGGNAPYTFTVTAGALPAGLVLSGGGVLSGTPTVDGTFNFTVTVTDSTTGTAGTTSVAYTLVIAAPTITLSPGALPDGQYGLPYNQALTANGGSTPYGFAVTSGTLPPGISLSSAGVFSGTPTVVGSSTFTVTATDHLGYTGSAVYTLAIANNPPVANPDTAQTLDGQPVTINVLANDTGTITAITIVSAPGHGTAIVSGTDIVYTPGASFTGSDSLQYTASGPGGTSAPALVTVNVRPRPVAVAQSVTTMSGKAVVVDLAKDASGGPFTSASLVSVPPSSSGTTSLNGYQMTFTPTTAFEGTVTVTFTLSNAYATSAVTAITINVQGRPDPTRDSEVMGILNAETAATRRFANSQIGNFQQRLEGLHDGDNGQEPTDTLAFVQGIVLSFNSTCGQDDLVPRGESCGSHQAAAEKDLPFKSYLDDSTTASTPGGFGTGSFGHSKVTIWTGGSINVGDREGNDGYKFETTGLSGGIDYRFSRAFALGLGVGYGRDVSDIGDNGSRSTGKAYTAGLYASYHPGQNFFIDGLLGYQWLSFDSRRYLTSGGGFVTGERDGGQWFASVSAGAKYQVENWLISPYARLDVARATLDAFTEKGDPSLALHYGEQDIDTVTGNLGLRLAYKIPVSFGVITPQLRLEYQHDFQGDSAITMNYADMFGGPFYHTSIDGSAKDRFMLGLGMNIQTTQDFAVRLEYRGLFGSDGGTDNGFLINLGKKF